MHTCFVSAGLLAWLTTQTATVVVSSSSSPLLADHLIQSEPVLFPTSAASNAREITSYIYYKLFKWHLTSTRRIWGACRITTIQKYLTGRRIWNSSCTLYEKEGGLQNGTISLFCLVITCHSFIHSCGSSYCSTSQNNNNRILLFF